MPSLKELRARITGVKSQRKITSAMKMVAASKLRRFQQRAEASRPYADAMRRMLSELAAATRGQGELPPLMQGGPGRTHLVVMLTSDLGLAGGFNANLARSMRGLVERLEGEGETVRILPVGRKGGDAMTRNFPQAVIERLPGTAGREVPFARAAELGERIVDMLTKGEVDRVTVVYNRFVNAMTQTPTELPLVPLPVPENDNKDENAAQYEFEPDEEELLARLLPRNLQVQLYAALLESAAGEQGARMTAMDNATRNAGKAIDSLSQRYNRTRQANITTELIEIISGAEAV
ncbi:ATP synthase F0F1 subunit gamma [Neoasaia chiangmaiensis NBRC 101099]|uniref:ATP synthase gamma chain n=1 Tax=Neoasaia chiangmaiensis TaxID=320497 RepID=A0A1U9KRD7_9PROT|nr:F0F1 ATP synthase subunit gamma [Neoasaia chiangmaiensis]AQS88421.1 F0F1 ATP synthase subunit gamma [Neoasaia chiangmaiensis]GBR39286.1 ATP synthase F0F1 subunit gamma [Neoasaia chiangmaiensis NBRC 101099]GEN14507.1 ATP synthase gamma chain [Neoasaia chiangmaiensis]